MRPLIAHVTFVLSLVADEGFLMQRYVADCNGVVWRGVEWCDVGVEWFEVVEKDVMWCDVMECDVVWCSVMKHDMNHEGMQTTRHKQAPQMHRHTDRRECVG